jgi:hypothetical protein
MGGGAFVAPLACAVLCLRRSNTSAAQPCRKHSRENCTPISSGSTSKAFQRTFFRRTLLPRCLGQLLLLGKVRLIPCTHTAHTARWPAAFSSVDRVYVRVYVPGCHGPMGSQTRGPLWHHRMPTSGPACAPTEQAALRGSRWTRPSTGSLPAWVRATGTTVRWSRRTTSCI